MRYLLSSRKVGVTVRLFASVVWELLAPSPLVCHSALPTIIHEEADYTYLQTAVIF